MSLTLKYVLFCILATLSNLITQRMIIDHKIFNLEYIYALFLGTLVGLVTKYALDKRYIFGDNDNSVTNNVRKFYLYTLNGVITTSIFWGMESLFYFTYHSTFARELGAIIGLAIGYFLKYRLDKKYVFKV